MKTKINETDAGRAVDGEESWLELVRRQVASLEFGVVQIVVHSARVVQVERTEKVRLNHPIAVPGGHD